MAPCKATRSNIRTYVHPYNTNVHPNNKICIFVSTILTYFFPKDISFAVICKKKKYYLIAPW